METRRRSGEKTPEAFSPGLTPEAPTPNQGKKKAKTATGLAYHRYSFQSLNPLWHY